MQRRNRAKLIRGIFGVVAALLVAVPGGLIAGPDCHHWGEGTGFFNEATPADVRRCLEEGADPNAVTPNRGQVPMIARVANVTFQESPDAGATRALLAAGADPNVTTYFGRGALHHAVSDRWYGWRSKRTRDVPTTMAVVSALLDAGANPNARTSDPRSSQRHGTPPSVIQTLRVKGAKFFVNVSRQEWTPLMLAIRENESAKIVELLLKAGGNPDLATTPENWTSLHIGAWLGNPAVIRLLLKHGADPAAVTETRRWTPLHVIAWSGGRNNAKAMESVGILLKAGVDPAARDAKGRTAWDIIQRRHGRELRKALEAGQVSAESRAILAQLQKAARG